MGDDGLTPWRAENRLMAAQHRANGIFSKLPFVQAVKVRKFGIGSAQPEHPRFTEEVSGKPS
jgi:hypothetical protein